MVWRREKTLERLMLKTEDINEAMGMLETLEGKKRFAYIYYVVKGACYYLCGSLDDKISRIDWRPAVKKLLVNKRLRKYNIGLWNTGRPIA